MEDAVAASAATSAHSSLKVVYADSHDHNLKKENDHQPCVQAVDIGPPQAAQLTIIITLFVIDGFECLAKLSIRVRSIGELLIVVVSRLTIIGSLTCVEVSFLN